MSERVSDPREKSWSRIHTAGVFLLFLFFLVWMFNFYLCEALQTTYYYLYVIPMVSFCLYFRYGKNCVELRALIAFWLCYILSRVLNSGETMVADFGGAVNFSLYYAFAVVGFLLGPEQRKKYLTALSVIVLCYVTALGVLSVVTAVFRLQLVNPITEGTLCKVEPTGFSRLELLGLSPNVSAVWFFYAMTVVPFLFAGSKKKLWRVLLLFTVPVNYLGLALTYSRNAMMAFSGCVAMLLVLLLVSSRRIGSPRRLAAAIVLLAVITIPAVYKGFDLSMSALSKVSAAALADVDLTARIPDPTPAPETSSAPAGSETETPAVVTPVPSEPVFNDIRNFSSEVGTLSGRTRIFKSAFITMAREPARLLRGCASWDVMSIADQVLPKHYEHMHNSFLEVMVFMGLPSLAAALLFSVLLIRRMILVFFSKDPRLSLAVKCLTIPLAGIFAYSMLEIHIFYHTEWTALFFYLISGMLLAWSYEVIPEKRS